MLLLICLGKGNFFTVLWNYLRGEGREGYICIDWGKPEAVLTKVHSKWSKLPSVVKSR